MSLKYRVLGIPTNLDEFADKVRKWEFAEVLVDDNGMAFKISTDYPILFWREPYTDNLGYPTQEDEKRRQNLLETIYRTFENRKIKILYDLPINQQAKRLLKILFAG